MQIDPRASVANDAGGKLESSVGLDHGDPNPGPTIGPRDDKTDTADAI